MTNEMWLLVLGAVLPPFIDLINRFVPDSKWRFVVSILFSLVAGTIVSYFQYGEAILADAGLIFSASQIIYKMIYDDSSLQRVARG